MSSAQVLELTPRGNELDPTETVVTLSWTVDEDGQVVSEQTAPPSNLKGIQQFCAHHGITLVPGVYELECNIAGLNLSKVKLPTGMARKDEAELLTHLGKGLREFYAALVSALRSLPSDEEILDAACRATKAMIGVHSSILNGKIGNSPLVIPNEVRDDFCSISGGCPGHSTAYLARNPNSSLDNRELAGIPDAVLQRLGHLVERIRPHGMIGEHGIFVLQQDDQRLDDRSKPNVKLVVGFVGCGESTFHGWLNDQLALRFKEAMDLTTEDALSALRQWQGSAEEASLQALGFCNMDEERGHVHTATPRS